MSGRSTILPSDAAELYEYGVWLRRRREDLGLTRRDVAVMCHCSVNTLQAVETGQHGVGMRLLIRLGEALNFRILLRPSSDPYDVRQPRSRAHNLLHNADMAKEADDQGARVELDPSVALPAQAEFLIATSVEAADRFGADIESISALVRPEAKAFHYNLANAVATVTLPFRLAQSAASFHAFQRIFMAEKIRALGLDADDATRGAEAFKIAKERWASESQTENMRNSICNQLCQFLVDSIESDDAKESARVLLRQGVVLMWSSFEVLARDLFRKLLNARPQFATSLMDHSVTRRRFADAKSMSIETLAKHGYDLSACMGDILDEAAPILRIEHAKDVYGTLFPHDEQLRKALDDGDLYVLAQRRHAIVHSCGIVDQNYIDKMGEDCPIGTPIPVMPGDIERYAECVVRAAVEMLRACAGEHGEDGR